MADELAQGVKVGSFPRDYHVIKMAASRFCSRLLTPSSLPTARLKGPNLVRWY